MPGDLGEKWISKTTEAINEARIGILILSIHPFAI